VELGETDRFPGSPLGAQGGEGGEDGFLNHWVLFELEAATAPTWSRLRWGDPLDYLVPAMDTR